MIRPARLTVLVCAALPLTACATFTDADLAAKVGDAELNYDDFERRLRLIDATAGDRVDGEQGRAVISNWVALELARPTGLVDEYAAGPSRSGVLCVSAVNVADAASADAAVAELRSGTDWPQFVSDTDPNIPVQGRQECIPTSAVGEMGSQLSSMTVDDPYATLVFPDGQAAVLRMQTLDELNGFELLRIAQTVDEERVNAIVESAIDADVYVDPKFGAFDAERFGVDALG